jgi:phosphatidylserine decarboxylase
LNRISWLFYTKNQKFGGLILHNNFIAKEGWSIIAFFAILTIILYISSLEKLPWLFLIITLFCIYFFRNPHREADAAEHAVVAPADGRIQSIKKVYEDEFIKDEAICISIFLSLFNVHVNRVPISGTVTYTNKKGFRFHPAYSSNASDYNVSNSIGLETAYGKVLVVQITGFIARRIISWVTTGDTVMTGQHLGLIRFGSCTEIYLPVNADIMVETGQRIRGGETIIAQFND